MNRAQKNQLCNELFQSAEIAFYQRLKRGVPLNGTLPTSIRHISERCLRSGCLPKDVARILDTARTNARRLYDCYQEYQREVQTNDRIR